MGRYFGAHRAVAEIDLIVAMLRNIRRAWASIPRRTRRHCVFCGHRVGVFLPYRGGTLHSPPLMRALDIVGSDIDNFECPRCGAHDRERHLLMYLQASGLIKRMPDLRILHFAPERQLAKFIGALSPIEYVKCDLHPSSIDVERMDIEHILRDDKSLDLILANHVLEHVENDAAALSEIHRVLKVGGIAILQTPFSSRLQRTWSDPGIVGDIPRLQAYGQEDHVRLYGKDIFDRFVACGFAAGVSSHDELLPDRNAHEFGVNPDEPFFRFWRLQ